VGPAAGHIRRVGVHTRFAQRLVRTSLRDARYLGSAERAWSDVDRGGGQVFHRPIPRARRAEGGADARSRGGQRKARHRLQDRYRRRVAHQPPDRQPHRPLRPPRPGAQGGSRRGVFGSRDGGRNGSAAECRTDLRQRHDRIPHRPDEARGEVDLHRGSARRRRSAGTGVFAGGGQPPEKNFAARGPGAGYRRQPAIFRTPLGHRNRGCRPAAGDRGDSDRSVRSRKGAGALSRREPVAGIRHGPDAAVGLRGPLRSADPRQRNRSEAGVEARLAGVRVCLGRHPNVSPCFWKNFRSQSAPSPGLDGART
jgi:hypothetical protein